MEKLRALDLHYADVEARLGAPLWLPPEPDLCGALGAALFALDSIQ